MDRIPPGNSQQLEAAPIGVCQHVSGHESLDYSAMYCGCEHWASMPNFTYWPKLLAALAIASFLSNT
jgi:hypothetical protein